MRTYINNLDLKIKWYKDRINSLSKFTTLNPAQTEIERFKKELAYLSAVRVHALIND